MGSVESVDYHGNNRKLLFQQHRFHFFGVTFISSYLFVSDWITDRIYKFSASHANGTVENSIPFNNRLYGLVAYDSSRQLSGIQQTRL